jgi:hypothetical protein
VPTWPGRRASGGWLGSSRAPGGKAGGRRFQLALCWLALRALLGAAVPIVGVLVVVAFNAYYWLPIRGESPRPQRS